MSSSLTAKGAVGVLKKGYQRVASLSDWSWDGGGRVNARAADVDTFWLDQGGLTLVLSLGRREWHWRNVDAVLSGSACTVQVNGKPELRV